MPNDGAPVDDRLRLTVIEARREDVGRGIVRLDPATLKQIGAAPGDVLEIEGRTRTVAKAMPSFKEQRGQEVIQLDGVARANAGAALGQKITVAKIAHAAARRVVMAPLGSGPLQEDDIDYIARRLDGLAMRTGDRVRTALFGNGHREFRVVRTEPEGPVMVQPSTLLVIEKARQGEADPQPDDIVTYDDLGGMEREIHKIREMIELPLTHPEIFDRLGMQPPKGVLLHGPPGCGKTLLGRAVAHECEAAFIYVSGPEIIQKFYGESEARLRKIFEDARRRAPCIIFFDEIDSLAPKRERVEGEVEKRVVAQLLALMDGLKSPWRRPTGPTASIRRCGGPGGSTARSSSASPMPGRGAKSWKSTRAACRSPAMSISGIWPTPRTASPAPIWVPCAPKRRWRHCAGTCRGCNSAPRQSPPKC